MSVLCKFIKYIFFRGKEMMTKEQWEQEVLRFSKEFEDPSPFDKELNEEFVDCCFEEQRITYRFTPQPWQKNERGDVHGGILGCWFDSAIGTAAIFAAGWREAVTSDLTVSYLRPMDGEGHAIVHAYIVKNGRSIIRLRGEMYCEETGKLVATAYGNWVPL